MLEALAARFGVRPEETVFVGDADTDRLAAHAAGVRFLQALDAFVAGTGDPG